MSHLAEARQRIAEARATAAPILDLGDLSLDSLPEELGNLSALRVLALGRDVPRQESGELQWNEDCRRQEQRFTELNVLKQLTELQGLSLGGCVSLTNVDALKGLTRLQSLRLQGCSTLKKLDGLQNLTGLQALDLGSCESLLHVGGLQCLTGLQELNLSWCPSLTNVDGLQGLTGLQTLYLMECTSLTNVDGLRGLTGLRELSLFGCWSLINVDGLRGLTGLEYLSLTECASLTTLDALKGLTGLQELSLIECESLTNVHGLRGLPGLKILNLGGCTGITQFAPLRRLLPRLKRLFLFRCRFQDLPSGACGESSDENVLDAVRAHYNEGDTHGWHADEELKVFVLGNGGVGKTQLCRRLRDLPYEPQKSTHGVQLEHIDVSLPGRESMVCLHLWDFGGQDIYHGSHTIFLQGRAVFILLWTPNTEIGEYEEDGVRMRHHPLAYWLDYVLSVAGAESPILIIQGKCDNDEEQIPLPVALPKKLSSLRCLVFSAVQDKEDKKLHAVRSALQEAVASVLNSHKAPDVPEGRVRLTRQLQQMRDDDKNRRPMKPRRVITQERFRFLCKKNGQIDMRYWREALRFLHFRGVLFWRPELFEGRIILDQSWALEAIYALFHRAKSLPTLFGRGRFTRDLLKELIWQDRSDGEQLTFLGMMESCGICFRVRRVNLGHYPWEWEYIAPELLPARTSPEVQHQLINLPEVPAPVRAEVRYHFLHEGVLRRFLSWLGNHVGEKAVYWRFGCWFHDPERQVKVIIDSSWHDDGQHPGQGIITLDAWGQRSVPLLEALISQLIALSPMQNPQVILTGFEEHRQVNGSDDTDVVPDAIVTRHRTGIGLGRISVPTPGRSVKGTAVTRWKGS